MAKLGYAQRIKGRIQELEAVLSRAHAELDELRIAERVLGRLGNEDEQKGPDDGQPRASTTKEGTVADMAIAALNLYGPADTQTILDHLQRTWRADLKQTTLASTLSRTKGEGRLVVIDGKWQAAGQTKEPPEGGSHEIGGDAETSFADSDVSETLS